MVSDPAGDLRSLTQLLLRRLGVLASDSTPCGFPISVAHAQALMVLLVSGELTQQGLGQHLAIDKSNVARVCAKMEKAGHIEQRAGEQDARSRVVSLTIRGRKLAREVDSASRERFSALLAALPRGRQSLVIEGMRDLVNAVDLLMESTQR